METLTLEALLLPWWKPIAYLFSLALLFLTVRIGVKFDVNKWMDSREVARQRKEGLKHATNCAHAWTLYHRSHFSSCNNCLALIADLDAVDLSELVGSEAAYIWGVLWFYD